MFNFKKRPGKDKRNQSMPNGRERPWSLSQALSPSAFSHSSAVDERSSSEPAANNGEQFTPPEGLQHSSSTFFQPSTSGLPSRSRSRSAIRSNDPLGLTVVHEPETSPPLDIIFVHGLGGTSRATWAKGRNLEFFWPQKWLPFEPGIRTARILSFGYNANFSATGPTPITGIADFAKDLLYSMKFAKDEHLEELELGKRPIIFIVHSMGGLVVKQAYLLGQNDEKYSDMVSSINAILFLATPHRGSNLADMLNRILTVSVLNHSPKLYISELKNGSQTIEALNDEFRHVASRLTILSFYETLPTSIGPKKMIVVDKASATLGYHNEISKSLNADHHTVCKFDSVTDANYISVRNALKTLVTAIRPKGENSFGVQDKTQLQHLQNLLAISDSFHDDLQFFRKRWTRGTCDWILSNPTYMKWVDEGEQVTSMLWLHALPASGKSILSSFIINHLLEHSCCVYYFFRFGDQSKRSLSTCLRTIAFQISEQLPQFRRALNEAQFSTTLEKTDAKTIWEKVFAGILFRMTFTTTIYWVIDALDESDHPKVLVDLMHSISNSSVPIKALLVSRQTPELISTFDRLSVVTPVVYLPLENTINDIRVYVQEEVQWMHAPPEFKSQIVERLVSGADGNFLWASLAVVEVMECNTQEDLDETLEGIPGGMEQLYQRMERIIIEKTRPRDQKLAKSILTWAVCSRRPLLLKELAQALQPEFSVLLDLKFTISRVCGQFVVVDSEDRLVMVHQTAREHITTTDSILAVPPEEGHKMIFSKCIAALEEKNQHRDSDRRGGIQKTTENQDFARYAATSWSYHLNMTSTGSDEPLLLLSRFLNSDSVLTWIASLARQNQLKVLAYSSKSIAVYVRRKRRSYIATNPLLHRLRELDLLDAWAIDFLKILGKFGQNLVTGPTLIYQHIPPFCPKGSMIYRQFQHCTSLPHSISVEGISRTVWDDSLAKISLGPEAQTLAIVCSGAHFAVLTAAGHVALYNSTTFEMKHMLTHGERVCAMSFSSCSSLLVTYGFRTTKVWSVETGYIIHRIPNPLGSRAFVIQFSFENTELIIGSNDRLIRIAHLTITNPTWVPLHQSLLREDTILDRPVHNVPWRIAFSNDSRYVAVAYRGAPLCVWSIDAPEFIGRCMRNQEYAGNSWSVVDQVIWHPNSKEVLGLYMGGHVFRWNPRTDAQQELKAEAGVLACSPDGRFFVIGDTSGTIKLYSFDHFALVYQLSCENMIKDILFSPDSRRIYDLRGQFCNVWEPNALIRTEDAYEQDTDIGSEAASIPTAAVSEAHADVRDQITAIAIQFQGRYQAIGNEAGVVSVVDSSDSDHVAIQLWRSPVMLSIGNLDWSADGNYIACSDLTGKVFVKQVRHENGQNWTATPVFDIKLEVSIEGIQQVIMNSDGTMLLVKNGPSVTVWHLTRPSNSDSRSSMTSLNTKWLQHPTNADLLLAVGPSIVQLYTWDNLSEVVTFSITGRLDTKELGHLTPDFEQAAKIKRVYTNPAGTHLLIETALTTHEGNGSLLDILEIPSPTPSKNAASQDLKSIPIPPEIRQQIEIPLGILPTKRLIFLDKDHWACSWRIGSQVATEKVQRYYFLPKDWLNDDCLRLCALHSSGRLLIPNNGELAVIKSTGLSLW